ncbi:MAG: PLP-dependent aminotransferase family protein [Rhodobacteraceae bacterium]|nr:PLP-dependent aminotransferase family protein [Paracoccaceae bacterium]
MDTIWSADLMEGDGPKYAMVASGIRRAISDGRLKEGVKVPPVRELAWTLGITPGTVARAYTVLTDEGVLQARVGRGTFVAPPQSHAPLFHDVPIEVDVVSHNAHNAQDPTDPINLFSPHLPNAGQAHLIRQLLGEVAQEPPSGMMHYPTRSGSRAAREAACVWLEGVPLGKLRQDDIVFAHGGQNAIMLVFQALLRGRRPAVLVEELAYPGFRRAAELLRADVIPVAMDAHGVIPEALDAAARAHDAQIFCTSPEVHNPTCGFTPTDRRAALVQVARKHDLSILEDDCYRIGQAQAESYRMLAPERAWYVSSISKSLTPALRVGMIVAPEGQGHITRRTAEYSFFGLATPLTDLCAKLFAHPRLPELVQGVQDGIGRYVRASVNILGGYDLSWREDVPFLWLRLPDGWRASGFVQAAEAAGVRIRAAEEYACRDARVPHAVRFAVNAGISLKDYEVAMLRLRELLDNPPERIGV